MGPPKRQSQQQDRESVLQKIASSNLPPQVRTKADDLMADLCAASTPEALIDAMVVPSRHHEPQYALYHALLQQHVEQGFPHDLLLRWLTQNPLPERHKETAKKTHLQDLGCGKLLNQQLCTFLLEHEQELCDMFGQCAGKVHFPGACDAWQCTDLTQQMEACQEQRRNEQGSQAPACELTFSSDDICPMSPDVSQVWTLDVSKELGIQGTIMCVLASMCLR